MLKFKPRLIKKKVQLKEHIIKFEPESKSLFLYDLKGLLLDKKYIDFLTIYIIYFFIYYTSDK